MIAKDVWDNLVLNFTSGNNVPVERSVITCIEYETIKVERDAMLAAIEKAYSEFERIKNSPTVSLRDRVYLDGVLAVLDSSGLKGIIDGATMQK